MPHVQVATTELDFLLERIAEALQLTPTQYQSAVEKYEAVGRWLSASESSLAALAPTIYPQGSMALQTTVRPLRRMEYDLDLVCEVRPTRASAMELFNAVYARLHENGTYRPILERKNRCVRLNYAGNFHLDIIPAQPDPPRPPMSVVVPDRKLQDWTPSNPRGYAAWFHDRSRGIEKVRAAVEALPTQTPPDLKTPLSVAVQTIKRRRDVMFGDGDTAPRSIVLTTLAGRHYLGGDCVATIITQILAGIEAEVLAAAPERIRVCNPTNGGERFCDSFTNEGYDAFVHFVRTMRAEVAALLAARDHQDLRKQLIWMFGDAPVDEALRVYAGKVAVVEGSRAGSSGPGIIVVGNDRSAGRSAAADAAKLAALNAIASDLPVPTRPYYAR